MKEELRTILSEQLDGVDFTKENNKIIELTIFPPIEIKQDELVESIREFIREQFHINCVVLPFGNIIDKQNDVTKYTQFTFQLQILN